MSSGAPDGILILFAVFVMLLSLSLHDCAQAFVAFKLGDPTARMLGRVTMNPVVHFDPWGTALSPLLSLFVFHNPLPLAWGKPVPMTFRNFRKKNDEMMAVCAGPAAQFAAAGVALVVLVVMKHAAAGTAESLGAAIEMAMRVPVENAGDLPKIFPVVLLLLMCITVNLTLGIFNLLPMPFLDGGKILVHFLPYNAARSFEKAQTIFLFVFMFLARPLIMIVFVPLFTVFVALLVRL